MKFSHSTIVDAWNRSECKCECKSESHHHEGRCNKPLSYVNPDMYGNGIWLPNRIYSSEVDFSGNCEILCLECYNKLQNEIKKNLLMKEYMPGIQMIIYNYHMKT
jgi:hypothetical protein